jgi:pilus assembly protein TadC
LKQSKGAGASGSFKIGEVVKPKQKPAAKPKKAFLDLTALVFFGDLVAFFAGLAAGFFAAAGFLVFGFAAFFEAVFVGVLAFLGLAAFGFTAFFGLAAGF